MKTDSTIPLISIIILVTSLLSVPFIAAHTPGTTFSYEVTVKVDYESTAQLVSLQPSPNYTYTILLQAEINYRVVSLERDGVTVHIETVVKDVRIDAKPQEFKAFIMQSINLSDLIGQRTSYTFTIPYSGEGFNAFNLSEILDIDLQRNLEQLLSILIMYGVYDLEQLTVVEVTTWENIPCICNISRVSLSMEIYEYIVTARVETRTCYDMTGVFPLSSMGITEYRLMDRNDPTQYARVLTEYTSRVKNIDVIKGLNVRSYIVKLEKGGVDIHLSGRNLSVLDITAQGNRLVLRLNGEGLGSVVLHSSRYIEIEEVLVDSIPVAYYINTSDGVVVIRIPVTFSERTVEVVFKEEIKGIESKEEIVFKEEIEGIESKEAKDTGTGWLFYALIVVPILIVVLVIAVAVVVVWKLLRKTPQA
ncbi:MAG: hypothetical protein QW733_06240 [Desulfurococcaceae archaeon]